MTTEPMKRCQFCGEEILAVAIKCKHCASNLTGTEPNATAIPAGAGSSADFGWALVGVPLVGTMLLWFWVTNLAMIQGPGSATMLIVVGVIVLTAALAAIEAGKLGMKADKVKGTYSPAQWMFMCIFLWVVGYPAYLFKRRHYGRSNLFGWGVVVALVFVGSAATIGKLIDDKNAEIQAQLHKLQDIQQTFATSPPFAQDSAHQSDAAVTPTSIPEGAPAPDPRTDLTLVKQQDPTGAVKIDAYCKKVAQQSGGAYIIEEGCRSMEIEAWKHMNIDHEFPVVEAQITQRCSAPPFSDSFSIQEQCIKMEVEAKASMSSP